MNNSLKIVFFDNDGILVDTEHLYFEANDELFKEMGIPHSFEDYKNYVLFSNKGTNGFLEDHGFSDVDKVKFKKKRDALWSKKVQTQSIIIDQVPEVIKALSKKYRLAIVTSSNRHNFEFVHKNTGLLDFFEFIICREDITKVKPEPECYLSALQKAGVERHEAIIIEDAPRGIMAGMASGIPTIAIPSKCTEEIELPKSDYTLDSIEELPEFLERL